MKKFVTVGLSLLLTGSFALSALCGCASKNDNAEADITEVAATSVAYNPEGKYTTQMTGADFSGISKDDVKVYYTVFDEAGYRAALPAVTADSAAETDEMQVVDELPTPETNVNIADYYKSKEAEVTNVTAEGSRMSVSFTDPDADANRTDAYSVVVENRKIAGDVSVEFESHTLTPSAETKYVPSTAKDVRLTLFLDGEFNETVTEDDISLSGSFEGMQIASLSAAGKNLTLQLTGDLKKDEASGAYSEGVIFVAANAIKGAREAVSAKIPVETLSAYFVGEKLQQTGTSYTLPLVLIDCGVDISSLTADKIRFYRMDASGTEVEDGITAVEDDITVDHVHKTGDDEVLLTLSVPGAADRNAAARKISGDIVKIETGEPFTFSANIAEASFYPVFDYVEEVGDKLQFTLELYAHSGTFANVLSAASFEFGQGFAGSSDVSVELTSDTTAELTFKIPANGQTVESLNVDGGVTIKAGGLKNMWGDATSESTSYLRSYTQDSLGRDVEDMLLSGEDLAAIQKIVGGFGNTTAGTLSSLASGAGSAGSAILTILDLTGIMPNKETQTLELLKEVAEKINAIQNLLNRQMALMHDVQRQVYNSNLSSFDTQVANISTLNKIVSGFLATAAADTSLNVAFPLTQEELATLKVKDSGNKFQYKNTTDEQDAKLKTYTNDLVNAVKGAETSGNAKYRGFEEAYKQLESACRSVLVQLTKTNDQNPMAIFDKMCTFTFNFSTSAYNTRYVQRLNLAKTLESALDNIAIYYGCDDNAIFKSAEELYETFLGLINDGTGSDKTVGKFAVVKPTYKQGVDRTTYCYVLGLDVLIDQYFYGKFADGTPGRFTYRYSWYGTHVGTSSFYNDGLNPTYANAKRSKNFSDDELDEFVYRMSGRTLRQELTLAGFTGNFSGDGMMFQAWKHNDGGYIWYEFRHQTFYYARIIKLDKKAPEQVIRTKEGEYNYYCTPGLWLAM